MSKPIIGLVIILIVGALGAMFLFTRQPESVVEPTASPSLELGSIEETGEEESPGTSTEKANSKVIEIAVTAKEFSFTPSTVDLEVGQKYRLTLKNTGNMSHNFAIEGTNIKTDLTESGETTTIEFSLDAPGEYTFYCSVPGHRSAGMEGTLTVE